MKLLHSYQPLFAPVDDGSQGGGAGSGSPAAFDQAAFSAAIMGEVSKALAGFGKTFKADLAKLTAPAAVVTDPVIDPATDGAIKTPADPALAAELRSLARQNKEMAAAFAALKTEADAKSLAADKKEQDATVRTKLNKFKFADEVAAEDAFEIFGGKIRRNEEGAFTGPDGTPIDQFLEEGMRLKPYLLAPKDIGGAGARGGKSQSAGKAVDFDSIKQGMSAADVSAAAAQISAVLAGQR